MLREDGRRPDDLRPVTIFPGYLRHPEGSALIELGQTRVLCTVSVEDRQPAHLKGTALGWVTAEYGMLPRATHSRTAREATQGRQSGRTQEIQRIIGRCLRAVTDLKALGPRTLIVDCDVVQADGGTRTAAITGAYVALYQACRLLLQRGEITAMPIRNAVAAVSVGVVDGVPMLDLAYSEDSRATVDFNVAMAGDGRFIELQGTAEGEPFSRQDMDELLSLAELGIIQLFEAQQQASQQLGASH